MFLFLLLFLVAIMAVSVSAKGSGDIISNILDVGRLEFLFGSGADNQLIGFVRILLAILVFAILYVGLSVIPHVPRNIAITVGVLLAVLVAVFTPKEVLLTMGATYSTIFAFIIIGGPILAIMALCLLTPTPNRAIAFLKFLAVVFVMWLISKISVWADKLGSVVV